LFFFWASLQFVNTRAGDSWNSTKGNDLELWWE
jgi:hypothetical protein